jgi:hypothetical protein
MNPKVGSARMRLVCVISQSYNQATNIEEGRRGIEDPRSKRKVKRL